MATIEKRVRDRLFADVPIYQHRTRGGFSPVPVILRRCQFAFSPRGWQVYTYLLMRCGPEGVAWPTIHELAWDLDFASIPKLKAHVKQLIDGGWIVKRVDRGRDHYVAADPLAVLAHMRDEGRIPDDRLDAIAELLEVLRLPPLTKAEKDEDEIPTLRRVRRGRQPRGAQDEPAEVSGGRAKRKGPRPRGQGPSEVPSE